MKKEFKFYTDTINDGLILENALKEIKKGKSFKFFHAERYFSIELISKIKENNELKKENAKLKKENEKLRNQIDTIMNLLLDLSNNIVKVFE